MMTFYSLETPKSRTSNPAVSDYFKAEPRNMGDALKCKFCKRYTSMLEWLPPFNVEMEFLGRELGDIAFGVVDLLVSEKFVDLFKQDGLTGLTIRGQANVVKVKPKRVDEHLPRYYVAAINYSKTELDLKKSQVVYETEKHCSICLMGGDLLKLKGIYIKESTWSGEDLLVPRGFYHLKIASQRFKEWCEQRDIKNANLIKGEDFLQDFS